MYLIDKTQNRIKELEKKTFSELGFKERKHLQEWLAHQPTALGEELLIIQKEFNGFNDTNERLDLLALDKEGNLVIIENKLDDTGRDVTWQVLKYASYCSTLNKEQIRNIYQDFLDKEKFGEKAEENLADFFEQEYEDLSLNKRQSQRVVIVAANFRKEVTSNVLWLLDYKLRIQCFKATPFALNDQLFLTMEQIIPTKDTEDFVISMADKMQEEISTQEGMKDRHKLRLEFWSKLLPKLKGKTSIYQNVSPAKDHWLNSGGTGISGVRYCLVITKDYAAVQIEFARSNKEENKKLYDELIKDKDSIEKQFGHELEWKRNDTKISSQVSYTLNGVNIYTPEDWNKALSFMEVNIINLERAMQKPFREIKKVLSINEEGD
ncbi:MAG TPA: DUF4268 domain-containing protein [Bacteroides graminisolvens]|jgi:hypothetical protein|uniref:DUF4268 domain-containing protein n=2 Tax=Bacteroides graminisolvens TaxID=477666 RepID=A0A3D2SGN2_9BACE|nr:DUF4268 domain-containing protein [Bacteroides graminisolvens]MCD8556866.1 DUF4268 domain-containing protein [Bacteroides graminisolvens]GAK36989.1 putative inner membrane protein [Bacteroides graminisolvens DSM 19988 = JCM 15093]HCK24758.1 DUF4268 domain-containing protein [Bacteroides graminisolvens]